MFDVLLVDGRHVMWRSADAFANLSIVKDGERQSTGAVFGFLSIVSKVRLQFGKRNSVVIVCWEGGNLKRRSLFPNYKRKPDLIPPDRLRLIESIAFQQGIVSRLMAGLNVPQAHAPGWEADDVMGSLAERWRNLGAKTGIFTGDRDLLQCLDERVSVIRPIGNGEFEIQTPDTFVKDYGIQPRLFPFVKALAGDRGDSVPGVRGIGEVKALKLIKDTLRTQAGLVRVSDDGISLEGIVETGKFALPSSLSDTLEAEFKSGKLKLWLDLVRIRRNIQPRFQRTSRWTRKELARELMGLRFRSWLEPGRLDELQTLGAVMEGGCVRDREEKPNQERNGSA